MSTYKLYYFDLRAAAEPIRIIFAQAGVKYEDIRYSHEQWPNEKQSKIIMSFSCSVVIIVCYLKRYAFWTHASSGSWRHEDSG